MRKLIIGFLLFIGAGEVFSQGTWDTLPRMIDLYQKRVALFESEKTIISNVLFLGNSITQGADWKKLLKDSTVVNRGIGGDITYGVQNRIDDVVRFKPKKLFLLIGVNDLSKGIPENIVLQNIFAIVAEIRQKSPATKVFVQSILPVNSSFKNFPKDYNIMDRILLVNTQLRNLQKRVGYTYVDLFHEFMNTDGALKPDLSYDGLHLNASGYNHWVRVLKEAGHL